MSPAKKVRPVLWYVVALVVIVVLWYGWALFPALHAPFSGSLVQKPAPTITIASTSIPRDQFGSGLVPTDVVKRACKPDFWLRPIQGRASYVTVHVTGGPQGQSADIRMSCTTYLPTT